MILACNAKNYLVNRHKQMDWVSLQTGGVTQSQMRKFSEGGLIMYYPSPNIPEVSGEDQRVNGYRLSMQYKLVVYEVNQ